MTREDLIRGPFDRSMRLLEIGPSHNPIVPKADGWQTTIVDHLDQDGLVAKYAEMKVAAVDRIEPVDYVWCGGPLTKLIPLSMRGTFDGLIASHVGEHFPDLIAFFNDAAALVKPDGLIALALPDKRVCFDFFQPLTTTGDLVDAHCLGRIRHQRKTIFNHTAYFTTRNGEGGWAHAGCEAPFTLINTIFDAHKAYESASEDPASPYHDCHAWHFTPKSFELLVLELNLLGYIDWSIRSIEPAAGVEFYVWLDRKRLDVPGPKVNTARLSLLTAMKREWLDPILQLDQAQPLPGANWPKPNPTIAVVVPLYNGSHHIQAALESVFRQSVPPDEIIVVDDGSTDNGPEIVERVAATNSVILLHKNNGGQSSARNLGVQKSTSELIAFLDQDDIWYDNHLEELRKPFLTWSARPLGWVYSNLDEINERGSLVCRDFLGTRAATHPKRHIHDCIAQDMYVLPSATLVSRKAIEAVGGFDERLRGYEDDDLFLRIFQAGYDNIYLEKALSRWRIYPGSTSYSPAMSRSRAIYTRKLLEMFPEELRPGRHQARELIFKRFAQHAIPDYEEAARIGDVGLIAEARAEIRFLAHYNAYLATSLFRHSLMHYRAVLLEGNNRAIAAAWSVMADAAAEMRDGGLRTRLTLRVLANPRIAKSAFALRRLARPLIRWVFPI